jgi:hypothetical protein
VKLASFLLFVSGKIIVLYPSLFELEKLLLNALHFHARVEESPAFYLFQEHGARLSSEPSYIFPPVWGAD